MSDEILDLPDDGRFRPAETLDDDLQRELDEALGEMSVFDMVDAEETARGGEEGTRKGRVLAIHGEDVFVDLGGKSPGILPARQFEDELPKINDVIEVVIERYEPDEGLVMLALPGAARQADWSTLEVGQIVEGRVIGHNKGGLELDVNGIRAFMPISQIEIFRVDDLPSYESERLRCEVIEVDRAERNLLVSRRVLLEREAAEAREKLFETLEIGQTVEGTVTNIMPYGAFVNIGGVDGLLHVRDMSYRRISDPNEVVHPGQKIKVVVLSFDRETRKVGLGLKQIMPDPWAEVETKWPVQTVVEGRVSRLAGFGAFVELEEGVEGLVPIGEITYERRISHPSQVLSEGQMVRVRIMEVDLERQRMSLSIKQAGDDPWMGASARWPENTIAEGTITRVTDFGAFVELTPGVEGLIHISELSNTRVTRVTDVVKEGETVQAKVLNVDEDQRRISLSIKQLATVPEYTGPTEAASEPEKPKKSKKRKKPLKGGLD